MYKLKHKETGLYFTKGKRHHFSLGKTGTIWKNEINLKFFELWFTEYSEFGKQGKPFKREDYVREVLELVPVREEEL